MKLKILMSVGFAVIMAFSVPKAVYAESVKTVMVSENYEPISPVYEIAKKASSKIMLSGKNANCTS